MTNGNAYWGLIENQMARMSVKDFHDASYRFLKLWVEEYERRYRTLPSPSYPHTLARMIASKETIRKVKRLIRKDEATAKKRRPGKVTVLPPSVFVEQQRRIAAIPV